MTTTVGTSGQGAGHYNGDVATCEDMHNLLSTKLSGRNWNQNLDTFHPPLGNPLQEQQISTKVPSFAALSVNDKMIEQVCKGWGCKA